MGGLVMEPWLVPPLAQMLSPVQPCKTWLLSFPPLHLGCMSSCPILECPLQSRLMLGTSSHRWQLL